MQAFVDMVGNIVWGIQKFYMMLLLFGLAVTVVIGITIYATAPTLADQVGERAEKLGDRAIMAAQEEVRARELAEDGWGYSEPRSGEGASRDSDGDAVGGWGD